MVKQDSIFIVGLVALAMVVLAWITIALTGSVRSAQSQEAEKKAAQIDAEIKGDKELSNALEQYTSLESTSTHINKLLADRYLFMPTWDIVKSSVPKDVAFTSISVSQDHSFRIVGTTKSVASVAQFAKALSAKPDISSVTPLSVDRLGDSADYNFSITFKATSPKGNLTDKAGAQ